MLERYKKQLNGSKKLAELIETVAFSKQQQIVELGLKEDPAFMEEALRYVLEWDDVFKLHPLELSELMHAAKAKPNIIATAIYDLNEDMKKRFLICCERECMGKVKDALEYQGNVTNGMLHTARIGIIGIFRQLIDSGKLTQPAKNIEKMLNKFKKTS